MMVQSLMHIAALGLKGSERGTQPNTLFPPTPESRKLVNGRLILLTLRMDVFMFIPKQVFTLL